LPARTPPRPTRERLARFCAATPHDAPRTMVVCAHPDDETAGAGARLAALGDAELICLTDGAPADGRDQHRLGFATRAAYARARRAERRAALALAGIGDARVHDLDVADQEAAYHLPTLARTLAAWLAARRPDVVLTHPYEGGHPDHDASAFAVHAAVRRLAMRGAQAPAIIEMTSYHARGGRIALGTFLPAREHLVRTIVLGAASRARKQRMIGCYASQRAMLRTFPIARERFRLAPRYDFTRPPHAGRLWYEWFGWGGMTGRRWCALAAEALAQLGLARGDA
jgi:LmbE family N-acetylglucosaminyl deacetylase